MKIESLAVGDKIPTLVVGPVSRLDLALFAGASGDHNPIHVDIDFARNAGFEDVFAHGMLIMAYLGRAITGWVPQSALRSYQVRFSAITQVGDSIECAGKVVEKIERNGGPQVRLELTATGPNGDVKLLGEALIGVPA